MADPEGWESQVGEALEDGEDRVEALKFARWCRRQREALEDEGFTRQEAVAIVIALVPPGAPEFEE